MRILRRILNLTPILLAGCIGTDFEPPLEPILRIVDAPDELYETEAFTLETAYFDQTGARADTTVAWESSNESVLGVDQFGQVVAISEGIATIRAFFEEVSDEVQIIVRPSQEAISIIVSASLLEVGESSRFRAEYTDVRGVSRVNSPLVTWSTSDASKLNVSSNGTIRGMSPGIARVYSLGGNVMDSVLVVVTENSDPLPREVAITRSISELTIGSTFQFEATLFNEQGQIDEDAAFVWSSSNTSVLTVSTNGLVFGAGEGSAFISAMAEGLEANLEVIVLAVQDETDDEELIREGTLSGRGGYDISGTFRLTQNESGLILTLENPGIDPSAPGPYYYLSNRDNQVAGGINLGKADPTIASINITADFPTTSINDFDYLVVWCEPFSVTLGSGEFSD